MHNRSIIRVSTQIQQFSDLSVGKTGDGIIGNAADILAR